MSEPTINRFIAKGRYGVKNGVKDQEFLATYLTDSNNVENAQEHFHKMFENFDIRIDKITHELVKFL